MRKTFSIPLNAIGEVFTLVAMAGLTVASAAALAFPSQPAHAVETVYLPTVVITAKATKAAEPVRLPRVEVVARRSGSSPS